MRRLLFSAMWIALLSACGSEPAPQLTFENEEPNIEVACLVGSCGEVQELEEPEGVYAPSADRVFDEVADIEDRGLEDASERLRLQELQPPRFVPSFEIEPDMPAECTWDPKDPRVLD